MSHPLSVYLLDNKICLKYGYANLDSIYRETAFLKLCKEVHEILLHVYSREFAVYGRDNLYAIYI